jgi:hypothetical protein
MSRLIEKLKKIHQAEPQPMGFALNRASSASPKMQLMAYLASENAEKLSGSIGDADAVLMEVTKSDEVGALEKLCRSKDDLAGGWVKASNSGTLKKALNIACDFVIFPAATPLNSIPKEKVGRILEVDLSWTEGMLRTLNDLPIDAVFIAGKDAELAITVNRLVFLQRLAYMLSKPILVTVPSGTTETELQTLWDMGIVGVVIEVTDEESAKGLGALHKIIEKLPATSFRKKNRASAILPHMQAEEPHSSPGEEEEEEDE